MEKALRWWSLPTIRILDFYSTRRKPLGPKDFKYLLWHFVKVDIIGEWNWTKLGGQGYFALSK